MKQLEKDNQKNMVALKNLHESQQIDFHSPLVEKKDTKSSLFEHTI